MGAEVERVYSEGGLLAYPQLAEAGDIDNAVVNLRFENGTIGNIEVSRNAVYGYDIRTEVLGTEGGLNIGYYQQTPLLIMKKGGQISHDMVPYMIERFGPAYHAQASDFVDRVLQGQDPAITGQDGRGSLLIGLAATQSYHTGQPVKVGDYKES